MRGVRTTFELRFSHRFSKGLKRVLRSKGLEFKEKLDKHLAELEKDPFVSRPNCDIKRISSSKDRIFRLRIGEYRIIYEIDDIDNLIFVTDIFKRERGYR